MTVLALAGVFTGERLRGDLLATVGYGDVVPVTEAGRLIGVGVIVVAVVLLAVITANISSRFVSEQAKRDAEGTEDDGMLVRLDRIEALLRDPKVARDLDADGEDE